MKTMKMNGNKQIFLCTVSLFVFSDKDWTEAARLIATSAKLTTLDWACHYYPGGAGSFMWFLGESHIMIDCYPESNLAEITMVSCRDFDTAPVVQQIMDLGWIIKEYTTLEKDKGDAWRRC